jgi:hypothetical protein
VITVLNPTSALAGASAFTLAVNGTNFQPGSYVTWTVNGVGSVLATTYVSSNQVTAVVPQADISSVGTATVTVTNPPGQNPSGVTSAPVSFAINIPAPTIGSISPSSVLVGSADTTVTVTGSNYTTGCVVQFTASNLTTSNPVTANLATTLISQSELSAVIPAAYLSVAGTAYLGVSNTSASSTAGGGTATLPFEINYPLPQISSLLQVNAPVNGSPFTLTVTGAGFISGSVVVFGGTALTTTFISPGQLNAAVTSADIQEIGTIDVVVLNPTPGGGASNSVAFTVTPAIAHTFAAGLQFFSAPYDYSGSTLGSIFDVPSPGPLLAVWSPTINQYLVTPNAPTDAVRPGVGYWTRFATTADLFDTGVPTQTTTVFPIPLAAGWNMIGNPFDSPALISNLHVLSSAGQQYTLQAANQAAIISVVFFSFDSTNGVYDSHTLGDALYPFSGYWIYAFANCALVVTPPGS